MTVSVVRELRCGHVGLMSCRNCAGDVTLGRPYLEICDDPAVPSELREDVSY